MSDLHFFIKDVIIIAKSELFSSIDDIAFIEKDPDTITRDIIKLYEDSSGRSLARSDPIRLFIDAIILAIIQQRHLVDHAAKQNLLAYAEGQYLDHLGALLGVKRLEAAPAETTLLATLPEALSYQVVIPAGTRVAAGSINFAVTDEAIIKPGNLNATLHAVCTQAGTIGNGYVQGQINKLVDTLPFKCDFVNLTESNSGTEIEGDEEFRERIMIAPESFTTAGSVQAYKYFARSAASNIYDVAIVGPPDVEPGHVDIYPLLMNGEMPSDEIITKVYEACNADNIRPDTDFVTVKKPVTINFVLNIHYWINTSNASSANAIRALVEEEIASWISWQRRVLGRDINPSELIKRVVAAGAKRCEVKSPSYTRLEAWQLATCSSQSIVYEGLES